MGGDGFSFNRVWDFEEGSPDGPCKRVQSDAWPLGEIQYLPSSRCSKDVG